MNVVYPFDTTGTNPSNLITGEKHTITEINDTNYKLIVPKFTPFYTDNLVFSYIDSFGVKRMLVEGRDYFLTLNYMEASRSIGKFLYGAIVLTELASSGSYEITTYQTLGGDWVVDSATVLQALATYAYNPRTTSWDTIIDKPSQFPVINHSQSLENVYGIDALIAALAAIETSIYGANKISSVLASHMADGNNPHGVSVNTIGLERVDNVRDKDKEPSDKTIAILNRKADIDHTHTPKELGLDRLMSQINTSPTQFVLNQLNQKSDKGHGHNAAEVAGLETHPALIAKADNVSVDSRFSNVSTTFNGFTIRLNAIETTVSSLTAQTSGITQVQLDAALLTKSNTGHTHNKLECGLGNVDNTPDKFKPLSDDTLAALALKADKTYVDSKISAIPASTSSGGLNTTQVNSLIDTKLTGIYPFTEQNSGGSIGGVWKIGTSLLTNNGQTKTDIFLYSSAYIDAIKSSMDSRQNVFTTMRDDGYNYTTHWDTWVTDSNGYWGAVPSKRYLDESVLRLSTSITSLNNDKTNIYNLLTSAGVISNATSANVMAKSSDVTNLLANKLDTTTHNTDKATLYSLLVTSGVLQNNTTVNSVLTQTALTNALSGYASTTYVDNKLMPGLSYGYTTDQNSVSSGYGFVLLKTTDVESDSNAIITPSANTIGRIAILYFRNSALDGSYGYVSIKITGKINGVSTSITQRAGVVPGNTSYFPIVIFLPPGSKAWIKCENVTTNSILTPLMSQGCY